MLLIDETLPTPTQKLEFQTFALDDQTPRLLPATAAFEVHSAIVFVVAERFDVQTPVLHPHEAAFDENAADRARLEENATDGARLEENQEAFDENAADGARFEANHEAFEAHAAALEENAAALEPNTEAFDPKTVLLEANTAVLLPYAETFDAEYAAFEHQGIPFDAKTDCARAVAELAYAPTTEFDAKLAVASANTEVLLPKNPRLEALTDVLEPHLETFEAHAEAFEAQEAVEDTAATPLATLEAYTDALDPNVATEFRDAKAFVTAIAEGGRFEDPPTSPTLCTIPR